MNTFDDPGAAFTGFWASHAPGTAPPAVDWDEEMVLVGALGEVNEAGDSVEVRRIIQDVLGTPHSSNSSTGCRETSAHPQRAARRRSTSWWRL